ncbi:MAG: hypothetical protein H6831_08425 [Planctomycetes bacterium]|nr:hypothetical protein [Planctomycetota bacterium]
MTKPAEIDAEPTPFGSIEPFSEADLHALAEPLCRDPQYNEHRLALRRKLGTLAKAFLARGKGELPPLLARTSLHAPHPFNGKRVARIWTYLCRDKAEKARLKKVVGADLAKDLDAAYRNAYLCIAAESEALEVSLRIHSDAWFDGANFQRRVAAEGPKGLTKLLNELEGFTLRLDDWKGEWVCGGLGPERVEEFFGYYKPGEHRLLIDRRFPAPANQPAVRALSFAPEVPEHLLDELSRLVPLYRFAAWSKESDFLFG